MCWRSTALGKTGNVFLDDGRGIGLDGRALKNCPLERHWLVAAKGKYLAHRGATTGTFTHDSDLLGVASEFGDVLSDPILEDVSR